MRKHLPAYLDEMCFRFNNRKNPYLFRDTITKLIQTPNLEYKELTAQVQEPSPLNFVWELLVFFVIQKINLVPSHYMPSPA